MIRVVCGCGRVFRAEDRHTGKQTRCPACGTDLTIGEPSASGSGEHRALEDMPSWWALNAPTGPNGAEVLELAGGGDPETLKTTVLDHGLGVEGGDEIGLWDDGRRAAAGGPGSSNRTLAGVLVAATVLTLGVLCWTWWTEPLPGPAKDLRLPRAGAVRRDDGRGPVPDRNGPPPVEDGPLAARDRGREAGSPARPPRRLRLLVPGYFYPTGAGRLQWRRLFDAAAKVDLVAVVNPDSGPGVDRNPDYAALIAEAAGRGVPLVGYINTQYAARPASEVKGEVDAWLRLYPRIAGFFLDQQPPDARHSAYLAEIVGYAREKLRDAFIISDPGIPCDESYLARRASDLVCVFSQFEGFAAFELPAHLRAYDSSRYAALVYQVEGEPAMRSLLKEAIVKRIGYIYVTDAKSPNPWNRLPTYWEAEVEAVSQLH